MIRQVTRIKFASYCLFCVFGVLCAALKLGPAVLAGLFSYTVMDVAYRRLLPGLPGRYARVVSLLLLGAAVLILSWMLAFLLRQSLSTIPQILSVAAPKVRQLSVDYGISAPLGSLDELREAVLAAIKENASVLTRTGGVMTKGFFQIFVGVIVAVLFFLRETPLSSDGTLAGALTRELSQRAGLFLHGFEKILWAQAAISGVNTALTAVFLLLMGFPYAEFLIPVTFILGLLPVVGNVLSNTIITAAGLSLSPRHAVFGLGFLIFIHKLEYFLNSKIVGATIHTPMWQILLAILLGEAVLGVPGIVIAPAVLHYVREELRSLPPAHV